MKRIFCGIAVLALFVGLMGAGPASAAEPIVIGCPLPMSGPMSMYGKDSAVALKLAVDEINAKGGVLGRPFKMIIRDTRLNPEVGVRETKDLILNQKAEFIIGFLSSGVALAASEYCSEAKKIIMVTMARSTKITEEKFHPYVFRVCTNFTARDAACLAEAALLWPANETDKVCELNLDYEQGHNAFQDTITKWRKLNPKSKLVAEMWPPLGSSDWSPYIAKLMASDGNILFHSLYGGAWISFVKQALPMGLYKKFHVVATCAADLEATHVMVKKNEVPVGVVAMSEWPYWALKDPKAKELADRMMKTGGVNYASSNAYGGYLAIYALKKAIEKAGEVNQEKIIQNLEGMEVATTMGPIKIRGCDHQWLWPVYAGKLGFIPGAGWPSVPDPRLVNVDKLYRTCAEIEKIRAKAK